jgi:hypothetical protein
MDRVHTETTAVWGTSNGSCKVRYSHPWLIFFVFLCRSQPHFLGLKISRQPLHASFCFDLSEHFPPRLYRTNVLLPAFPLNQAITPVYSLEILVLGQAKSMPAAAELQVLARYIQQYSIILKD